MIEQTIFGIEWLIDKNIKYLNIKPEYILILEKNIKLVDYGIKFLNNEIINNYMSSELIKNQLSKKLKKIN